MARLVFLVWILGRPHRYRLATGRVARAKHEALDSNVSGRAKVGLGIAFLYKYINLRDVSLGSLPISIESVEHWISLLNEKVSKSSQEQDTFVEKLRYGGFCQHFYYKWQFSELICCK